MQASRTDLGKGVLCAAVQEIYADFNSGRSSGKEPCWCLRHGDPLRPLDDVAQELGLQAGMFVTLYYEDPSEEFEVSATLQRSDNDVIKWVALPDWVTFRRIP